MRKGSQINKPKPTNKPLPPAAKKVLLLAKVKNCKKVPENCYRKKPAQIDVQKP